MKTVLVVDSDLGFVFWLGHGLDQTGYAAFPAKSVPTAKKLLGELKIGVDLLIVNSALPDAAGLVDVLRGIHQRLKVVVVADDPAGLHRIPDVDLRFRKPDQIDESTREDLIAQIERVLPPFAAS